MVDVLAHHGEAVRSSCHEYARAQSVYDTSGLLPCAPAPQRWLAFLMRTYVPLTLLFSQGSPPVFSPQPEFGWAPHLLSDHSARSLFDCSSSCTCSSEGCLLPFVRCLPLTSY